MNKLLVLGSEGFTGKYLYNCYKEKYKNEFEFVGIDINEVKNCEYKYINVDLLNNNFLEKIILEEKPEYIINLAGIFNSENKDLVINVNSKLTMNLCEILIKNKLNPKRILLIGSAAEYGNPAKLPVKECDELKPVNIYGLSKVIQTKYAEYYYRNYGLNIIIARTFNVIGKGISDKLSIGAFIKRIKEAKDGDTILVGNLETKRDYLPIETVVDIYFKLLLQGKSGEIYNVCSGKSISMKYILEEMIKYSGKNLKYKVNPEWISDKDVRDIYGDNKKIKNIANIELNIINSIKSILEI